MITTKRYFTYPTKMVEHPREPPTKFTDEKSIGTVLLNALGACDIKALQRQCKRFTDHNIRLSSKYEYEICKKLLASSDSGFVAEAVSTLFRSQENMFVVLMVRWQRSQVAQQRIGVYLSNTILREINSYLIQPPLCDIHKSVGKYWHTKLVMYPNRTLHSVQQFTPLVTVLAFMEHATRHCKVDVFRSCLRAIKTTNLDTATRHTIVKHILQRTDRPCVVVVEWVLKAGVSLHHFYTTTIERRDESTAPRVINIGTIATWFIKWFPERFDVIARHVSSNHRAKFTGLFRIACGNGDLEAVQWMMHKTVEWDDVDSFLDSVVKAIESNRKDVVACLLFKHPLLSSNRIADTPGIYRNLLQTSIRKHFDVLATVLVTHGVRM